MDLHCTICGEPWDNDYLHDVADDDGRSYQDVVDAFKAEGCAALDRSATWCRPNRRGALSAAMADLMGDDVDGWASAMDDADAVLGGGY